MRIPCRDTCSSCIGVRDNRSEVIDCDADVHIFLDIEVCKICPLDCDRGM